MNRSDEEQIKNNSQGLRGNRVLPIQRQLFRRALRGAAAIHAGRLRCSRRGVALPAISLPLILVYFIRC
jgi:hypothetical protein